MKKLFSLHSVRKADARVRDDIKHEVRKYVRRELNKAESKTGRREIICRVGPNETDASAHALKAVSTAIDDVAAAGADHVFVEIKLGPVQSETLQREEPFRGRRR
jgi:hypothetical protein